MDAYGSIACIANGMDTKTYIEVSEAFAKLTVDYQSVIKRALLNSVPMYLAQMAKDASCFLSTIKVYEYMIKKKKMVGNCKYMIILCRTRAIRTQKELQ